MNKKQALAMLTFIADLYSIIQAPEQAPAPQTNGHGTADVQQAQPMTIVTD